MPQPTRPHADGFLAAVETPLRLFRRLLPTEDRFIANFVAHARLVVEGTRIFCALFSDGPDALGAHYAALERIEKEADGITDATVQAIHRVFITPFDRGQILELISGLDDILDLMKDTGRRVQRYGVTFTPEMIGMAECAIEASIALSDAMPLLAHIGANIEALDRMQSTVRRAESKADELLDQGLSALFAGDSSPGHKLTVEKVYDLVEAVVDRCEDVADVIQGIVIEQV